MNEPNEGRKRGSSFVKSFILSNRSDVTQPTEDENGISMIQNYIIFTEYIPA